MPGYGVLYQFCKHKIGIRSAGRGISFILVILFIP